MLRRLIARLRRDGDVLLGLWQEDLRWSLLPTLQIIQATRSNSPTEKIIPALPGDTRWLRAALAESIHVQSIS